MRIGFFKRFGVELVKAKSEVTIWDSGEKVKVDYDGRAFWVKVRESETGKFIRIKGVKVYLNDFFIIWHNC